MDTVHVAQMEEHWYINQEVSDLSPGSVKLSLPILSNFTFDNGDKIVTSHRPYDCNTATVKMCKSCYIFAGCHGHTNETVTIKDGGKAVAKDANYDKMDYAKRDECS